MSSSSNSPSADRRRRQLGLTGTDRRRLLLGLLGAVCAGPLSAVANTNPTAGLRRWGSGEFRRFGFLIYVATLWAGDDPLRPPLALRLDYRRSIRGSMIAEASIAEMKRLGSDEQRLAGWGEQLARVFPDVAAGDSITGVYRPDGVSFLFNGQLQGEIADAALARQFFAIWLDPSTSAPDLRAALLRRPEV